jgi:hypothetical protein
MNHLGKRFIDRQQLRMMLHEINPSVARIIINENDIILVTTFGNKRTRAPYIRMYKSKRMSSFRVTRRIWELNLFPKFIASIVKRRIYSYMTKYPLLS